MTIFHEAEPFQTLVFRSGNRSGRDRPQLGYMQKGMDETKMKLHTLPPGEISLRIDAQLCFNNTRIRGIRAIAPIAAAAFYIWLRCRNCPIFLIINQWVVGSGWWAVGSGW